MSILVLLVVGYLVLLPLFAWVVGRTLQRAESPSRGHGRAFYAFFTALSLLMVGGLGWAMLSVVRDPSGSDPIGIALAVGSMALWSWKWLSVTRRLRHGRRMRREHAALP